jgi:hypothetical protein
VRLQPDLSPVHPFWRALGGGDAFPHHGAARGGGRNFRRANASVQGERLLAGLRVLQTRFECIGDVRGIGLME